MDKRYLELDYKDLRIVVKLDEEGVVLDVWKKGNDNDVVATTWKTYDEFGVDIK